jgi:hypothetical protein
MNAFRLPLLAVLITFFSLSANAAGVPRSDSDCRKILDSWAKDVKSVPKRVLNECKERLANVAPPAGAPAPEETPKAEPAAAAIVDPCSGPGAMNSVLCWGPWAALAPAAAGVSNPAQLVATDPLLPRAEVADPYTPGLDQVLPLGSCAPGSNCGFATVVSGVTSSGDPEETRITRFDMAPDGSQFTVDPNGTPINSVTDMGTDYIGRPDQYQNLFASGRNGDQQSRLVARTIRDDSGTIQQAADVWTNGNRATGAADSGYFAWGTSTTQTALNTLNAGSVSANFSGPMSVDSRTNASITVNFGTQPNWTGTWTNPGYTFGAGGRVSGVDFLSNPAKFTPNVQAGSYVQGILLGQPGNLGVAHAIDVTLTGAGRVKDVGLIREGGSAVSPQP